MNDPAWRHLSALYEKARAAVADEAGHWKPEELLAELTDLLGEEQPEHVARRLQEMQAQDLARRTERARHPRRLKRPAGTLYHPDAIVPLGGDRVLMAAATPVDLNAWNEIIARNLANQSTAAAENLAYTSERLAAFRSGDYERLHDVEVALYGWEPPADGEYDDGPDGPDDDE